jgi:hypothetical protein
MSKPSGECDQIAVAEKLELSKGRPNTFSNP